MQLLFLIQLIIKNVFYVQLHAKKCGGKGVMYGYFFSQI